MNEEKELWIKCQECGEETNADLSDCSCENCGAFSWSAPFEPYDE